MEKNVKMAKKGKKLTTTTQTQQSGNRLTSRTEVPFILSFKYKLETGYGFSKLKPEQLREFQVFLDKVSAMTVNEVDLRFRRKSDSKDTLHGSDVIHYWITPKFRIHGIMENSRFKVVRMDPLHRYHK